MAPPRKILLADADPATARGLAPALRQQGWQVHAARDGSRALQLAVLRAPDLVLFDERCPLLEPRTFARILRANPRTARIPVVVLGRGQAPERGRLAGYLQKPLREQEVLARVDEVMRRVEAGRAAAGGRELEGDLAEIALADVLQVLAANRKSGRLRLGQPGARGAGADSGEVVLREGRAIDASAGPVSGEKALFRLLGRRRGTFSFAPEIPEDEVRIDRRMDEVVLEGMRQVDEAAALAPLLPAPDELLDLPGPPGRPGDDPDLDPVAHRVVEVLARPATLPELLDRAEDGDLDVLRALAVLLEKGAVRRRPPAGPGPSAPPLLDAAELHQLRARIQRGRSGGAVGKVLLAGGGPLARRAALSRLVAIPGFHPEPTGPAGPGLGTLGRLSPGAGVALDLVMLPLEPDLLPAWRAFAPGALGALVLLPADGLEEEHAALLRDLRIPVAVVGPSPEAVPGPLASGPQPASFQGLDPAEALRALLCGQGRRGATELAPP